MSEQRCCKINPYRFDDAAARGWSSGALCGQRRRHHAGDAADRAKGNIRVHAMLPGFIDIELTHTGRAEVPGLN